MQTKTERQDDDAPGSLRRQRAALLERMCAAATSAQSVREAIVSAMLENGFDDDDDDDDGGFNSAVDIQLRRALDETNAMQHNLVGVADWLGVRNFPFARFKVTLSIQRWYEDKDRK